MIDIRIAGDRRDQIENACRGDRWLYACYSVREGTILFIGGDGELPSDTDEAERVSDAINHEYMHGLLHREFGRSCSSMYDQLLKDIGCFYLHEWARGDEQ